MAATLPGELKLTGHVPQEVAMLGQSSPLGPPDRKTTLDRSLHQAAGSTSQ
jgi:hypothetical protein